jgi:nucleoside-diphosphate-sugar epimerase
MPARLLIFGLGYCGMAIAEAAAASGWQVRVATRTPGNAAPPGVTLVGFETAEAAITQATHLVATAAPDDAGDPVLRRYGTAIGAAGGLRWAGYLSTTGVYGDRDGGWVDEASVPAPGNDRSRRRLLAEQDWAAAMAGRALDLFRLAGIYGPGRSALDDVRTGRARRVVKPGHAFARIHRDDIVRAVLAALAQTPEAGTRVLNLADDEPAETALVVAEAARLLDMAPPPAIPFAEASAGMSPTALSFWAENRKVANAATKAALGIAWRYPGYREGLRAILAHEAADRGDQQRHVLRP